MDNPFDWKHLYGTRCQSHRIPPRRPLIGITGNYTMMIKLYATDNAHLMDLLNNKIQQIPGVTSTETLISLQQSIQRQLPIVFPNEE